MRKNTQLNIDEFELLYGKEKISAALKYGKDLKDIYTVLWMYYDIFYANTENE